MSTIPTISNRTGDPGSAITGTATARRLPAQSLCLALLLLLAAALAVLLLNNYENWGDDWASYVLQAQAIMHHDIGTFLHDSRLMIATSAVQVGPPAYPWGFPLILSIEASLFGASLFVFKLFNVGFYVILVALTYHLGRTQLTPYGALALAAMFATNPVLLHYCNHILSELPFTVLTISTFLAMAEIQKRKRNGIAASLFLGVCAAGTFVIRPNGILMLPAISVWQIVILQDSERKSWRTTLSELTAPYASFLLACIVFAWILPTGGASATYVQIFRAMSIDTVLGNTSTYFAELFKFFTGTGAWSVAALLVLGPVGLIGALARWRQCAHLTIYTLLMLLLLILWPTPQPRYVVPIDPLLVLFVLRGFETVARIRLLGNVGPALCRVFQFSTPLLFLATALTLLIAGKTPSEQWHPYDQPSQEMFQWIQTHTASNDLIAFFKPRAMHLLAHRLSITATPKDVPNARFLVLTGQRIFNEAEPPLPVYQAAAHGNLTLRFHNKNFDVYEVGGSYPPAGIQ